jgi:uncharacterized cupin superfamily protein
MRFASIFTSAPDWDSGGVATRMVARQAGAESLGASVYEMQPGSKQADMHFHHRNEEMIVVLEGPPTLHTLSGSQVLATGDVVCCLRGRRGAHRVSNDSGSPARVLIVSTIAMPEVVEYPERPNGGGVFVMTEPPHTEAPLDESRGRTVRLFWRKDALPIRPDVPDNVDGAP